ncbi:hypothetical protein OIU85_014356 [Salix viminalis]|uniref:Uncharacterized protein n=1 Tax=Salix viminalis TaxID=40686 RepID=A0A9Q0NIW7_SALVM|nr:hypothetical protein OIU85_014356 [Salix viminalis]
MLGQIQWVVTAVSAAKIDNASEFGSVYWFMQVMAWTRGLDNAIFKRRKCKLNSVVKAVSENSATCIGSRKCSNRYPTELRVNLRRGTRKVGGNMGGFRGLPQPEIFSKNHPHMKVKRANACALPAQRFKDETSKRARLGIGPEGTPRRPWPLGLLGARAQPYQPPTWERSSATGARPCNAMTMHEALPAPRAGEVMAAPCILLAPSQERLGRGARGPGSPRVLSAPVLERLGRGMRGHGSPPCPANPPHERGQCIRGQLMRRSNSPPGPHTRPWQPPMQAKLGRGARELSNVRGDYLKLLMYYLMQDSIL